MHLAIAKIRTVDNLLRHGETIAEVGVGKALPGPWITERARARADRYDVAGFSIVAFIRPRALVIAGLCRIEIGV